MKSAIIIHGVCDEEEYFEMDFPSPSNAHWLPWLQQKLLRNKMLCQTPEMPTPYNPNYENWKKTFQQFDLGNLSIVIGHSAGCGFFLKYLTENKNIRLEKLILVAPFLDPEKEYKTFLKCDLIENLFENIGEVHILYSKDDMESILQSVDTITNKYKDIIIHKFENKGHFCYGDIGSTFDELWNLCK